MRKIIFLVLITATLCVSTILFAATPPVYPGAKVVEELAQGLQQQNPENTAYNTFDSFEKVYAFYKDKGTEVSGRVGSTSRQKVAHFVFKEMGFSVSIMWKEDAKSSGTIIYMLKGVKGQPTR